MAVVAREHLVMAAKSNFILLHRIFGGVCVRVIVGGGWVRCGAKAIIIKPENCVCVCVGFLTNYLR